MAIGEASKHGEAMSGAISKVMNHKDFCDLLHP